MMQSNFSKMYTCFIIVCYFLQMQIVPCHFKDRIIDLLDNNWLVAETSVGRLYDLHVLWDGPQAIICRPYCNALLHQRDVNLGDIMTIQLFDVKHDDDDDDEEVEKVANVFVTASDADGLEKPHVHFLGN